MATMVTRNNAVKHLFHRIVSEIGNSEWSVVGGNRLRTKFMKDVEGIILLTASGYGQFRVSFEVGPRFLVVEKIVNKAAREAGMPEAYFKTAALFPTVSQRMNSVSNLPDGVSIQREDDIINAIRYHAIPFINRIKDIRVATDYATLNPGPYGHHSMRLPVLQAICGQKNDAMNYLASVADAEMPKSDFFSRYLNALRHLL